MNITLQLGVAAAIVQVAAFVLYNKQIFLGTSIPNTTTWFLWTFLTVLNASSYAEMTADLAKYALPLASAMATILTFFLSLFKGKFKWINDPWDWAVLAIGVVAGFVWWYYQAVVYANLIVVGAAVISFWPLCRGVWNKPALEKPAPWIIWTVAYAMASAVVCLRWRNQYQDLVYPVSMLLLHPVVALLTLRRVLSSR